MEDYEKMVLVKGDRVITLCKYEIGKRNSDNINVVIEAKSMEGELIGLAKFILASKCYLTKIEVLSDAYINSGVGKSLIDEVEGLAKQKGCRAVYGRFLPTGKFENYAKDFYLRNGYILVGSGKYVMLEKQLETKPSFGIGEAVPQSGEASGAQNGE